jgi:SulP family sulfate permease
MSLLAIVVGTAATSLFSLHSYGIQNIGHIPSGLPEFSFHIFTGDIFYSLVIQAFLIALVGFVETFSIAQSIARTTKERIVADKELVGQGMANLTSGLVGGFPVSGSFSGSALALKSGGVTNVTPIVAGAVIFLALLILSPLLSELPRTVLAGVVIAAVIQLIDISAFKKMFALSRPDGITALATALLALCIKPDDALFLGICLGMAFFVLRSMRLRIHEVGFHTHHKSLWIREGVEAAHIEYYPHVLILRFDTSLMFANADTLQEHVTERIIIHEAEFGSPVKAVVFNGAGLNYIDTAGLDALSDTIAHLEARAIEVRFMLIKDSVTSILSKSDFFNKKVYINGPIELSEWAKTV